jgi:hypothetical protein
LDLRFGVFSKQVWWFGIEDEGFQWERVELFHLGRGTGIDVAAYGHGRAGGI